MGIRTALASSTRAACRLNIAIFPALAMPSFMMLGPYPGLCACQANTHQLGTHQPPSAGVESVPSSPSSLTSFLHPRPLPTPPG